jgi:hypothetical protein
MANKQIARALGIREGTVKAHLTGVFQPIGVRDRTSTALWAHTRLPESREREAVHLGPRPARVPTRTPVRA